MNKEKEMEISSRDVLSILMEKEPPRIQTQEIKHKRLSEEYGEPVLFEIKHIDFETAAYISKLEDSYAHMALEGIIKPNLKDVALLKKYGAATPIELLKDSRFMLPGELSEFVAHIDRLSGYKKVTTEVVKKK